MPRTYKATNAYIHLVCGKCSIKPLFYYVERTLIGYINTIPYHFLKLNYISTMQLILDSGVE